MLILRQTSWAMKIKTTTLMLCILLLVKQANAQNSAPPDSSTNQHKREFNLSVFTGFSFLGPKNDIGSNMSSSGFGDTRPRGWFGGPTPHPFTRSYPIFDIEATYYLSQKKGISLNVGLANNIEVLGYDAIGLGNFIFLKSETWAVAVNYLYSSKNKRNSLFIGPSLLIHRVRDTSAGAVSPELTNLKPGIFLGFSHHLVQKKRWFMAFKTNLRAATDSEIRAFVATHQLGIGLPNEETFTSVFTPAKVRITSINTGLSVGIRGRTK